MTTTNVFENLSDILTDSGLMSELMADSQRKEIKISDIEIEEQVRTSFNSESITELAESISSVGVLQNIIVNKKGDKYSLIAGERRLMASEQAGKKTIPALILNVDNATARKIQLLENIQRENLTAIELAQELKAKLEDCKGDYDAVAAFYNKSRAWVSKAIRMNELTGAAAEAMAVTSDQEALLAIQQIEAIAPEKAAALVDEIKVDFGKTNTRKKAQEELRAVKDDKKALKKHEESLIKQAKQKKTAKKEEQTEFLGILLDESHPFYCEKTKTFLIDANSRIEAVKKMDLSALNKAEDTEGVQKSVLAAIQARRSELVKRLPSGKEKNPEREAQKAHDKVVDALIYQEPPQDKLYYIFSTEKNAFWKSNKFGYCDNQEEAGKFAVNDVTELVNDGRINGCTLILA